MKYGLSRPSILVLVGTRDERLGRGKPFGATHTVNIKREEAREELARILGDRGADVAMECAGTRSALELAMGLVGWRGRVALEVYSDRRGPLVVYTLAEDDVLGWHWIVPPHQWIFDAHCVEMVRAIKIDGKVLQDKCKDNEKLCHELLERFAKIMETRIEAITLQLLDIYGDHES